MATFRKSAIVLGITMSALLAGNAFAIGSESDCESEGGEVFKVNGDVVCVVPIRAKEFHGEEYDDMQLGIKECNGDVIADGAYCRVTLVKAPKKQQMSDAELGKGLKVGDIVNEKGEKVSEEELKKEALAAAKKDTKKSK